MIGSTLKKYKIIEEIGRGGMAVVYRGLDIALNRAVAVKVLHPHLQDKDKNKARFQREAQSVAKLRHAHILEIYDYSGTDSEESYIVTELIKGQNLKDYLESHSPAYPELGALIIIPLCEALTHAHSLNIIHRDIKPENIMIRDDGTVKLMDFGIAQVVDAQAMTATGTLLGSPAHMAPEHLDGEVLDIRADVFSLGTVLYLVSTGRLPFWGRNTSETLRLITDGAYPDPQYVNPLVSDELAMIIHRALMHEREERYQNIASFGAALKKYLAGMNLVDLDTELHNFFDNQVLYEKEFKKRLLNTLTRKGLEAYKHRRMGRALKCFDRVLALDPGNQVVLAKVDRIGYWRRIISKVMQATAAVALLFAVLLLLKLSKVSKKLSAQPVNKVERLAAKGGRYRGKGVHGARRLGSKGGARAVAGGSSTAEGVVPAGSRRRVNRVIKGNAETAGGRILPVRRSKVSRKTRSRWRRYRHNWSIQRLRGRRKDLGWTARAGSIDVSNMQNLLALPNLQEKAERRMPLETPYHELKINTWPKGAKVWIDSRFVGFSGMLRKLNLAAGVYKVKFSHPMCHPWSKRLTLNRNRSVAVRLDWKMAKLKVMTNRGKAAVTVNGVYMGTANQTLTDRIDIPIPKRNEDGRVKVKINLIERGYYVPPRWVNLRAGQSMVINFNMVPK